MGDTANLESETKWSIPAECFERLAGAIARELGPAHRIEQRSRFFDTPDQALRTHGVSVRLRRENHLLRCTSKTLGRRRGDRHERDEYEITLPIVLWPLSAEIGFDPLRCLPLPALVRDICQARRLESFGGFTNRRLAWRIAGAELALDRSRFPGGRIDHELEIEGPETVAAVWRRRLTDWDIPFHPQHESKLHRFVRFSETATRAKSPTR